MNRHMTSAELKRNARTKLIKNPGTVIGAFLVYMACLLPFRYCLISVGQDTINGIMIYTLITIVIGLLSKVLEQGMDLIGLKLSCNQSAVMGDVFYGFKGSAFKVLSIFAIPQIVVVMASVPMTLANNSINNFVSNNELMKKMMEYTDPVAMMEFMYSADVGDILALYEQMTPLYLFLFGTLIIYLVLRLVIGIMYSQMLFLTLDYPEKSAGDIVKLGIKVMKGNWGRLLYVMCSFIPWEILSLLTLFIADVWVKPYKTLTYSEFYIDLMRNYKAD